MTNTLNHFETNTAPSEAPAEQTREQILDGADELRQEMNVFIGRAATGGSFYNFANLDPKDIINE